MDWKNYVFCLLGVVISVILPVLSQAVKKYWPSQKAGTVGLTDNGKNLWIAVQPYILLGLFSAVVSLLVVFVLGDQIANSRAALLAGYAWDSTVQKIAKG